MSPRRWLLKSEPLEFSIEDLRRAGTASWDGVRNYQARNHLREMRAGDQAFFYHSSVRPAGIAGVMEVVKPAHPDPTQFDREDDHFEPRASLAKPVWDQVAVRFVQAFPRLLAVEDLRRVPALKGMVLFTRGRLSVQPVTEDQWRAVLRLAA